MAGVKLNRVNYYTGETSNQLRDGFGVYYYANKFFRYEGDWVKGKKHGHGKLILNDGSYYEGEFKDGEIEGHGFRKWQHTGNTYSGEFHLGEMHGFGVLNYSDGSQYKGEFNQNCRHGNGVFCDNSGNEYEGSWHNNKQNGHGILTFHNGDIYEGTFVRGSRQGHGLLRFADGGVYEGQWHADLFSGEGKMVHRSGVIYDGLWLNGQPALTAKELTHTDDTKSVECQQGQAFNLELQVVDQNGNALTEESGRKFEISAGLKYVQQSKSHQSLLELIEDIEEKPIATPFGYDVLPYPILEQDAVSVTDSTQASFAKNTDCSDIQESVEMKQTIEKSDSDIKAESILIKQPSSMGSTMSSDDSKSWLQAPLPVKMVINGFLVFENLFLPYMQPKVSDELKSKKSKSSRTVSAVSSSSSEGKTAAGAKQKIPPEKGANPGQYVLIIREMTEPPFLGNRLEAFFTTAMVAVPKQLRKSKSKLPN